MAQIVSSLSGGGTIVVNGGTIRQLSPFALAEILKQADALPDEKLETRAKGLVMGELVRKPFEFSTAEAAFSIAGGVLRIGNMSVATGKARLVCGLRLDLGGLAIDGNARLSFEAGEEAISGVKPEVDLVFKGPLTGVTVKRDASLLASFLTMRARERKERAYEAQKEEILEAQRLTRMVRLYKSRARMRDKVRLERENKEKLDVEVRLEEEKLLKELEATEENARKARLAIQKKQRAMDEKRRQEALLKKQKQLEQAEELERQKADLTRRQKAFDKLLRQQKTAKKPRAKKKLPGLAPPIEVRPTGSIKDLPGVRLPGVFENVEDKIGAILKKNQ
jgi:flagellar biosynthesis GTPase FlhF